VWYHVSQVQKCILSSTTEFDSIWRLCAGTADCPVEDLPTPKEGDVKLVPLNYTTPTTGCGDVHYGLAQVYHEGQWGYLCENNQYGAAKVICNQLGFPFGSPIGFLEPSKSAYDSYDDVDDTANVRISLC
jgi:hypothetical protein